MGNVLFCSPQKKLLNLSLFQLLFCLVIRMLFYMVYVRRIKACTPMEMLRKINSLPFTAPVNAKEQLPTKSELKTYIFGHIEDY